MATEGSMEQGGLLAARGASVLRPWRACALTLSALLMGLLLAACSPSAESGPAIPKANLQEDQTAMPEMGDFDSLYPNDPPAGGLAPLGQPSAPAGGNGALLGQ
jgi:hypothetical protein